ncbi:MAG: hypothetical protein H6Q75_713 [Firmicutes bacterium]|nr:hypothetical protein [Bacillota bacterium]
MLKKVVVLFVLLLYCLPVYAAPQEENSAELLKTVLRAQSVEKIAHGVWVIPETAINDYFAMHTESDKLKNPSIKLLGDNRMQIAFDSSMGRVNLTCEVKQFVHNQTQSYAQVYIRKKEVAGKPFMSWMLKFIPMGAIANLYGNPLKDSDVDARFDGNTLKINFRPLMEKTLLNTDFGRQVEINSITVSEGVLELNTNLRPERMLGLLVAR